MKAKNSWLWSKEKKQQRWLSAWKFLALLLLLLLLLFIDHLCYQQALPIELEVWGEHAALRIGSEEIALGHMGLPISLQFASHDPVIHEYQIDGTDSTNNFTLDPEYLHSIASSPYYRFHAWMRDLDGTSRWSDLRVYNKGKLHASIDWPANGTTLALQPASSVQPSQWRIQFLLRRPQTPMTFSLNMADQTTIQITINRNDRKIEVVRQALGKSDPIATAFFPRDALPFVAMLLSMFVRSTLWALLLLLLVLSWEVLIALVQKHERVSGRWLQGWRALGSLSCSRSLHPLALLALLGSLCFVTWIAYVQYRGQPHIYDANAYFFAAKMYASGHLSVPIPPVAQYFPGPFMVQFAGRWFAQYAPGTALTLVPGLWLGVPWLVEPLLGTAALLGIGLLAARLYNRRVATVAVLLGTFSPFYSYLAASYLSHTVALFYLVWGLWALIRFVQGGASWNIPLAALCFGMAGLTRDLVTVLFVAVAVGGMLILSWCKVYQQRCRLLVPCLLSMVVMLGFVGLSLAFNLLLTHSLWTTPRSLFFSGDRWGFGPGVGFYGQHTLAAGLVNLDEQLTILAIDLFGWPFYLTFAFLVLPFLTWRARKYDWYCLCCALTLVGAYSGYFYHGIYLGPRYLFEALPFLLILTSRGILTLAATARDLGQALRGYRRTCETGTLGPLSSAIPTFALVLLLLFCNLFYFLPRQIEIHRNFSGLPHAYRIDLAAVYSPPMHNALVVTGDYAVYQLVLFPLNDPLLHGDVIYAWANNTEDYAVLQTAFPQRKLFRLAIAADGKVQYIALGP